MPQAEKKYTKPMQDGRRKIHPKEHKLIREMKKSMSSSEIAKKYNVSVSLIKIIVYPKRQQSIKERNKRVWKDYHIHYGKEYHAKAIKKYRAKKRNLGLTYNPCPVKPTEKTCPVCGNKFFSKNFRIYDKESCKHKMYRINNKIKSWKK